MIFGIGTDMVDSRRIAAALARYGEKFVSKLFNEDEVERYRSAPPEKFALKIAKLFAAKEAFFKALGTGVSGGLKWRDISVVSALNERPRIETRGSVADYIRANLPSAHIGFHISTSDEPPYASAVVVIGCE